MRSMYKIDGGVPKIVLYETTKYQFQKFSSSPHITYNNGVT